jgi:potassium/chloride transporter 9
MGASRVMEAVAKDILFGPFLAFVAQGTVGDNPVAAVLVTWVFVEFFLLMGALNTIAQVFKFSNIHYGTQLMPSVVFLPKNW